MSVVVADDKLPKWALEMRKKYQKDKNGLIEKGMEPVLASGKVLDDMDDWPWEAAYARWGIESWGDVAEIVFEIVGREASSHIEKWKDFEEEWKKRAAKKRTQSTETHVDTKRPKV